MNPDFTNIHSDCALMIKTYLFLIRHITYSSFTISGNWMKCGFGEMMHLYNERFIAYHKKKSRSANLQNGILYILTNYSFFMAM